MSDKSKIQWTDASWNPVCGCTKVSAGCKNCYAERMAGRLACMKQRKYQKVISSDDLKWNGKTYCDESALDKPLHWKNPRRIFVCSMGDLFHESVPFEFIAQVYAVAAICQNHTFQVLTKRPERAMEFEKWLKPQWYKMFPGGENHPHAGLTMDSNVVLQFSNLDPDVVCGEHDAPPWPLPNLWLGVTVENAKLFLRIFTLKQIPAAVRFLSIEPLLENIILTEHTLKGIDWVIIGCESGPGKRELHIEHIYNLVEQCKDAKVPVFVKQIHKSYQATKNRYSFYLEKNIKNFPKPLQIREYPKE